MTPIEETDPQLWYMKIFKDVSSLDVDMVVPGGSIDFSEPPLPPGAPRSAP